MGTTLRATWQMVRGLIAAGWTVTRTRGQDGLARDRGDVPGWVLITLMTAGIVTALWVVAEPALSNLLTNALNVSGDPSK